MKSFVASAVLALSLCAAPRADACRVIEVSFTPANDLQLVVWLEDAAGNFIETLYITRMTGTYGIGNRPGRMDFNSELLWPYGRRETVFPVWSHRHGEEYPSLVFQDEDDSDLSHIINQSSAEPFFCRPLRAGEPVWMRSADAGTCATPTVYTDKGKFVRQWDAGPITTWSRYPPRNDLDEIDEGVDHPDVGELSTWNDLDAVSQATPPGGALFTIRYSIPDDLAEGEYVILVEASSEFDQNEFYDFPSPAGIPWSEYGDPYRGQPSVIFSAPFTLDADPRTTYSTSYDGYGDPDGLDGNIRLPDATITANIEGSGASRLLVNVEDFPDPTAWPPEKLAWRMRVSTRPSDDDFPPETPTDLVVSDVQWDHATLSFREPGDDAGGWIDRVTGYEVRWLAGAPLDETNFDQGVPLDHTIVPVGPGSTQSFPITNLLPETIYYVAIRAHDGCLNRSPVVVASFTTPRAEGGEVGTCFVATAAYGSPMAADVGALRGFRDDVLRASIFGEIFVGAYYTFGPPLAETIRPSETLRAFVRAALGPVVRFARSALPSP